MTRKTIEREGKTYRVLDGTSSDSLYFFDRGVVRLNMRDIKRLSIPLERTRILFVQLSLLALYFLPHQQLSQIKK